MFSTLDKLDFTVGAEGARRLFQTDHRSAKQVAKDIDLSVVFAILRCVAPRTIMKGGDEVLYSASHRPPDAVVDAIAACGARLEVGSTLAPLPRARESADVLLDRAMRTLAANTGASELDLAALEKKLLQRRPKKEKNEVVRQSHRTRARVHRRGRIRERGRARGHARRARPEERSNLPARRRARN